MSSIYFWKTQQWLGILVVGYIAQIIAAATFWLLPDSPRLLAELKQFNECKKSLEAIAKWNHAELHFNL